MVNWMEIAGIPADDVLRARVKIRYHDSGAIANISQCGGEIV